MSFGSGDKYQSARKFLAIAKTVNFAIEAVWPLMVRLLPPASIHHACARRGHRAVVNLSATILFAEFLLCIG